MLRLPPDAASTPFEVVAPHARASRRTKAELVDLSRSLETFALEHPDALVLATFQHIEHASPASRAVYRALAAAGATVALFARGFPDEAGVIGLGDDDPLVEEWNILVVGPSVSAGFVARDLDPAHSMSRASDRAFAWCTVEDRALILQAAAVLLTRAPHATRCHEALARMVQDAAGGAASSLGA